MVEIKNATIKDIATRVKRQRNNNNSNTAILIGAGCSVSAGIPTCNGMMKEMESKFSDLLTGCDKTYQAYMDRPTASERKVFLDHYINNAKLNLSHIFLASLVREKYVDCILTTNFDNLALKALTTLNQFPAVYDLASSSDFIPRSFNYPSIVYLHGQHTGLWQMNTGVEMDSVKNSIARAFDEVVGNRTLIVVGYGGNDPVLDVLKTIPRFNDNAYWVGYKSEQPDKHIQEAMFSNARKGIYYLPKYDSDKFFFDLHNELALDTPSLFSNPFQHLEETYKLISEQLTKDDEPYDLTGPARKKILQAEKCLAGESPIDANATKTKKVIDDLTELALNSFMGWKKNDPDKIYEKVISSKNKEAKEYLSRAFVEKGNSFYEESRFESAKECYEKATIIRPDSHYAFYNWGIALIALNPATKTDESLVTQAIEKYQKATTIKPDFEPAFNNWGVALAKAARAKNNDETLFKQAIDKYEKAISIKSDYNEAFYNWGNALALLAQGKNYDEVLAKQAIEKYEKAIALKQDYPMAYSGWGNVLIDLARAKGNDESLFKEAINKYEKAVSINPDYYEALYNWGNALADFARAKNNDEALFKQAFEKYERAVTIKPDLQAAFCNWGNAIRDLAEGKNDDIIIYRQAIAVFEKGKSKNAANLDFYTGINSCLIRILLATQGAPGREKVLQEILTNTQLANEVKPYAESYNLACAYSIVGRTEEALVALENALDNKTGEVTRQHIETDDPDLANIRLLPAFKALLDKYMPKETKT